MSVTPRLLIFLVCLWLLVPVFGRGGELPQRFLERDAFLQRAFDASSPEYGLLMLDESLKSSVEKILGHPYRGLRVRYWIQGERTAWILNEVGKVEPITLGLVVEAGQLCWFEVMVYRESRGGEVRYGDFRRQFEGASLEEGLGLDREVDGITGATLSVAAVTRAVRLALFFHDQVLSAARQRGAP